MAANINDKLKSTWNSASPAPTNPSSPRTPGATTLACVSLNWPTDTAVDFATFGKNADGSVNQASVQEFTGIVSGNNLTSIVLTSGGADQGNNITEFVVMKPTSKGHQDLVDAIKVSHKQDGTLKDDIVTTAKIADGAVTPEKRSGGFKVGVIPSGTFGSTGNKAITGIGFKPRFYRLEVMPISAIDDLYVSSGSTDGTTQQWKAVAAGITNRARQSGTDAVIARINQANIVSMKASHVSMDNDGFTINVTAANNAFDVAYEAYA